MLADSWPRSAAFPRVLVTAHEQPGFPVQRQIRLSCPSPLRAPPPASPLSFVARDFFPTKGGLWDRRAWVEIPKFPQAARVGAALTANRGSAQTLANLEERKREGS